VIENGCHSEPDIDGMFTRAYEAEEKLGAVLTSIFTAPSADFNIFAVNNRLRKINLPSHSTETRMAT